ncbi:Lovastatin diketide synthase LovF [Neonectria ditissima]|uniref:Lovastatin diketide synthase LovF n=1 Tax=Neonectria ditissima TaxID=78410 RepID=A0A0P7BF93_9HYPO|nr:Lovastatin diketide synthase LovF [Neonectria ditissima]
MQDRTPIAIVGLSYRAPGVGRKGLWEYLAEAKSAWSRVPAERFDYDGFHHPDKDKAGCIAAAGGHFLPGDIYSFDAPFFNLRTEEARAVDPHHRMLLECALEAAESAGVSLADLAGSNTGVFSAIGSPEHGHMLGEDMPASSTWTCAGGAPCMFANRLSYFFDLSGPSIALDAACASSTYAVHMACQSLLAGECDSAFAGGSALLLGPGQWSFLDTMGALSPEGKSFSYDVKASGFGRGEGGACLLMKRLDDALEAGDPIHAIISNSAVNHGGRSDGITMPRQSAQEQLLRRVHREIGLDPSQTPVVEGHGTGTKVGHLEGASGVLGMVKAIMMLEHGYILPNADFDELNENIKDRDRLRVPPTALPWPADEPRRVCVTNFGFGGSNSAIILQGWPATVPKIANGSHINGNHINGSHTNGTVVNGDVENGLVDAPAKHLYVLSAKSESSLTAYLASFKEYLDDPKSEAESSTLLKNLAFTLGQRRSHHSYRVATTAASLMELQTGLSAVKPRKIRDRTIAFVFTGQGAQHAQMATGLGRYKVFADAITEADAFLRQLGTTWSLKEELDRPPSETRVGEAEISQPACTAVQVALVLLLKSWAVEPTMVTGHSSGEIGAAFAAGLVSFQQALAIAYFRGRAATDLIQRGPKGAMLALGVGVDKASALLADNTEGYATIAAINSPSSVTVSGDVSAIDKIHKMAEEQGLFARKLKVEVAYHSRHMEQVADAYRRHIEPYCIPSAEVGSRGVKFVSSSAGGAKVFDTLDASYWVNNLVQPVRFSDTITRILSKQADSANAKTPNVLIEIGPHSTLQTPIKQTAESLRQVEARHHTDQFNYLATLKRDAESEEALLQLAQSLFCLGAPISLAAVNQTDRHNARVLPHLPAYAWDRSVRYMLRSRITEAKLHPGQPYHPMLGWKSPYTEGSEMAFRQVFTLDEMPWIRQHAVGGQVIFPMTGYLSLAMGGLRRIASGSFASLVVREFHARRSLEIEEDERVDITTKLRPAATGTETFSSTAWVFEILSWSHEYGWTAHCHGRVEVEPNEPTMDSPTFRASAPLISSSQLKERDPELEYTKDNKEGTTYGPAFKRMKRFWEGPGFTVMESEVRELDLTFPSPYGSPVSVDTPTLDSFLQGLGPLLEAYGEKPAMMPNYVSRLRISNNVPADANLRLTTVTRLVDYDVKAGLMRISVAVFMRYDGALTPVAEWESVSLRVIAAGASADPASNLPASYCWDLIPSLNNLADDEKLRGFLDVGPVAEDERQRVRLLNQAAIYFMDKALQDTAADDTALPPHLARFKVWASACVQEAKAKGTLDGIDTTELVAGVSTSGGQGEMVCAVGEQLAPILRGEVQALEIMLKENRLSRYYDDDLTNVRLSHVLARWVRHQVDVKSGLRILEVGAGTGSATLPVFEAVSRGAQRLPDGFSYTYTDISSGFFEAAREKLDKWAKYVTYSKLDISRDPAQQGFDLEAYDLVIASNVLHATPNMTNTVDHVRSLMKPNGSLVVLEAGLHAPLVLPFALLPGWWLAEDEYRTLEHGPLLNKDAWSRLFTDRGFSGLDGLVEGYPNDPENILSIMTTTRVGLPDVVDDTTPITICGPMMDGEEEEFAQMVSDMLVEQLGCETEIKPFAEVDPADDAFYVFVDSRQNSIFKDVSEETFDLLRDTFLQAKGMLWVIPESHTPDGDTVKGMLRTVRLENESRSLLMVEDLSYTPDGAAALVQLAKRLRDAESTGAADQDFTWHEGSLWLPRYRPLAEARETFASEAGVVMRKEQRIRQDAVSFEMTVDAAGSPDSIYFKRTDALQQPLADDAILVQVEASGVNFRDVLVVLGSIPWTRPGFEGSGTVLRVGPAVEHLRPGDEVFFGALHGGSFATHLQMPAWHASRIPEGFSAAEAAGISVAYSTAVMSVLRIGRLQRGESVLVHAASGAVGQACIVLARHVGAEVYVTAGSPAKRDFLRREFGIAADHVFNSRTAEFRDGILAQTGGRGVDVVINSLSGNLLQETWAIVADFGRFVELGKRDVLQNSYLPMRPFDRNVTFAGVDLRTMFLSRPAEHRRCLADIERLIELKVVVPIRPLTAVSVSQIPTAMRKLQSGQNIGKIVITMDPDAQVMAELAKPLGASASALLRPDKTYIITGGTGGIGLSLGPWMVENGARSVVLLGRSGSSRPEVQKVLAQYQDSDVSMRAVACDVSSREDVANAVQSIQGLPPVGGVVHGALFLEDKLLCNTTHQDWLNIVLPRIKGAWNLHELLPDNLDFFVALSSFISGSGNIGQSVYSGTASFYDAFAEYRSALGQPTVSVALPVVLDVGYVADRDLEGTLTNSLGAVLSLGDLRTVVKGAILGPSSGLNRDGKAISFSYARGDDSSTLPWQCFHPRALVNYIRADSRADGTTEASQGAAKSKGLQLTLADASDPLAALLAVLMDKVSSITMIERDEIEADAPLSNYSLDSLVSVELRNWIRRETGVDLQLPKIVNAANLRALATHILAQREAGGKTKQTKEKQ